MTTPDGRPSVTSLEANITRTITGNIEDDAQRQASAMGSRVISTDADDSVYGDESSENVTAPRGPQT
jgi:hypothetical protein